jgi:fibronectin-binding autotransporter adhesin
MALATTNVSTVTDSFQNWIDKTNILLDAYSTTIVTTAANTQGGITTGNGTVNGIFTANSITVNGNTTFGLRGGNTTTANVLYITSNVSIGNTTVNTVITTTTIDTDLALTVLGATTLSNTLSVTGTSTLTGNATLSGVLQIISGNSNFDSGVLFVDSVNNRVGINNTTPTLALEVTGAANISTSVNSALITVGTSFIANTTGAFHTGTVNAASFTTSGFVANTTAIVPTSNTILLGNSVGRFVLSANTGSFSGAVSGITTLAAGNTTITGFANVTSTIQGGSSLTIAGAASGITTLAAGNTTITGFANISTSVNSALLTVGTSFIANTTGAFHTGIINAASHTTSGFVANTTAIVPTSNTILLGNSIGRFVLSANSGNFSGNVSIVGSSNSGSLNVSGNISINTFATFLTFANTDLGSNTTANVTAISFPKANHQAGELLIYLSSGSEHQITKILFAHNGTDVNQTIYGTIVAPSSSSPLANNIIMTVNSTNIDVNLRQRVSNSSVKILANMII